MQTLQRGASGTDVELLQRLLCKKGYHVGADGIFGNDTEVAVRKFQKDYGLVSDGIVGQRTWDMLQSDSAQSLASLRLTESDFKHAAELLGVEVAAIKAVLEVETGNKGGFLAVGKPTILFEGHIFWSQLKNRGIDPAKHQKGNEDILYPKWTKTHYQGGLKEYERLERARVIHGKKTRVYMPR